MSDAVPSYGRAVSERRKPRLLAPVVIAEISRAGRGETIRVCLVESEGRVYVDIRRHRILPDGQVFPGRGVRVGARKLRDLRTALDGCSRKLAELGLLEDEAIR